jgi:hypothetical protein
MKMSKKCIVKEEKINKLNKLNKIIIKQIIIIN